MCGSRLMYLHFQGCDVIGLAETGSGKTGAFALPILQALLEVRFHCMLMNEDDTCRNLIMSDALLGSTTLLCCYISSNEGVGISNQRGDALRSLPVCNAHHHLASWISTPHPTFFSEPDAADYETCYKVYSCLS